MQSMIFSYPLENDGFQFWRTEPFKPEHGIQWTCISMVSCQKGPTRHAYAWQIGPFNLWSWPFAWPLLLSMVITPENFMMIRWEQHCKMGMTDAQTDGWTDGQPDGQSAKWQPFCFGFDMLVRHISHCNGGQMLQMHIVHEIKLWLEG